MHCSVLSACCLGCRMPAHASIMHSLHSHRTWRPNHQCLVYFCCRRYEIWCIARAVGTRCCVLHCAMAAEQCRQWNAARPDCYSQAVFDDLAGRFERPDSRNRWDAPLFECAA